MITQSLGNLSEKADEAADLLRALSSGPRLLVLCHLAAFGETSAGELVARAGLSQSALSQHLARLREQGLVAYRREGQSLVYRITDERALTLLTTLRDLFCPELEHRPSDNSGSSSSVEPA